jgi:CHAD domain-containing protein
MEMAYRLRRNKAPAIELSRVVTREFQKALEEIGGQSGGRTEAIHEARKHVKKIRAVLRLLQKKLGEDYRNQNRRLRAVAHQLSSLRDADATTETMKAVRDHFPRLVTTSIFGAVCRGLSSRKRGTVARLDPDRLLLRVEHELRRAAKSMPRLIRREGRYAVVRAGVARGYRRARKAMAAVHANPEDTRFHTWRRRVKDHWYHMRLLEDLGAQAKARARGLKRLETWLGDDHNLVLLRAAILSAPARFGDERTTALVLGCIAKYTTALRRRALKSGERTFASTPGVFRHSIDRWRHDGGRKK